MGSGIWWGDFWGAGGGGGVSSEGSQAVCKARTGVGIGGSVALDLPPSRQVGANMRSDAEVSKSSVFVSSFLLRTEE